VDSGQSLLTGCSCSKVVFYAGLTALSNNDFIQIVFSSCVNHYCKNSQTCANDHLPTTTSLSPQWTQVIGKFIEENWITLCVATTSVQRPLFGGPEGGRCTQVWLYRANFLAESYLMLTICWARHFLFFYSFQEGNLKKLLLSRLSPVHLKNYFCKNFVFCN
jgi:hypothetical protein